MPRTGGGCQRKHRTKGYDAGVTTKAPAPGTTTTVTPESLHVYHRNPRRGDIAAIAASLRVNGQYKPITVNIGTHTGRPNEVLAGNHTLIAFRDLSESDPERFSEIKVHWVDVDDDTASRIVVADNRISELGGFDAHMLSDILKDLDDLAGTGYTDIDLGKLLPPVVLPPEDFPSYDQDISTDYCCPKCGYEWSGKAN